MKTYLLPFLAFAFCFPCLTDAQHTSIFEENKGQYPDAVLFQAGVPGGELWLEKEGITYSLFSLPHLHEAPAGAIIHGTAVKVRFGGCNPNVIATGAQLSRQVHNHYRGNDPSRWVTGARTFGEVTYDELYAGVDLVMRSQSGQLKYDLLVSAGVDPSCIKLIYAGADDLRIDADGNLEVVTATGTLLEQAPVAWQNLPQGKMPVPCEFRLTGNTLSFAFPDGIDPSHPLVIDPVLKFSTYVPGANTYGMGCTYDGDGNNITSGLSFSAGWPLVPGTFSLPFSGGSDIVLANVEESGTSLNWSTYLGGAQGDQPHALQCDSYGRLYVLGSSNSSDFPTTPGAVQPLHQGMTDLTVSLFSASGSLVSSTYVGGGQDDGSGALFLAYGDSHRSGLTVGMTGNVIIASTTKSSSFPCTPGAADVTLGGPSDAVVMSLSPLLDTLQWCTYLGGSADETAMEVVERSDGRIYVAGGTNSTSLPGTAGAYQPSASGGDMDGFVTCLSSDGSTVLNSTYLGTSMSDIAMQLDFDGSERLHVAGHTRGNWPMLGTGGFGLTNGCVFLMALTADLDSALFSTAVVDSGANLGLTVFGVDHSGVLHISGFGTTAGLPVTPDALMATGDGNDWYIASYEPNCTGLRFATLFGDATGEWDHTDGGVSAYDKQTGVLHQTNCAEGTAFPVHPAGASGAGTDVYSPTSFQIQLETMSKFSVSERIHCGAFPHDLTFTNLHTGHGMDSAVWDFGDGTALLWDTSATVMHTFTSAGIFNVTLTVWDAGYPGGMASNGMGVRLDSPPVVSITESGGVLYASGGVTYQWLNYGVPIPMATGSSYTPTTDGLFSVEGTSASGCTGVSDSLLIVGIPNPLVASSALMLWPNPAQGEVRVALPRDAQFLEIVDVHGRVLLRWDVQQHAEVLLDLSDFSAGVYWVRVWAGGSWMWGRMAVN